MSHDALDALLIASLTQGATVTEAAKAAGCSRRTVHRRLADPAFRDALKAARRATARQAVALLTSLSVRASQVLGDLLSSKDERVQLQASRAVHELRLRGESQEEFDERLSRLESLARRGLLRRDDADDD